ncbi:winged helix-turn-helix domain-containing protein [Streptomyces sp. NPDC052236]|uniref:winged helix-turn-helix domain-containing protein n=1 Tax=Streptomyces sp. NPDC052236 TaxID=3365686 RepID=UPI0037D0C220
MMRWQRPVLYVKYPAEDRDLHLNGRGLTLVPSYFCRHTPVSLADPALPPVLSYPVLHEPPVPAGETLDGPSGTDLLGRASAATLCAAAGGATTGEIARAAGVSSSFASRHATALRNAGLITSTWHGPTVLPTLTPVGASMLRAATRAPAAGAKKAQERPCREGESPCCSPCTAAARCRKLASRSKHAPG